MNTRPTLPAGDPLGQLELFEEPPDEHEDELERLENIYKEMNIQEAIGDADAA